MTKQIINRQGFTLLEVLVALAVLSMIVLMMSMSFQQSADAWTTASHRAGMDMMARSIVGRIEMDLMQAVPPVPNYTLATNNLGVLEQTFTPTKISFLRLKAGASGTAQHELRKVTYSNAGGVIKREERLLNYSSGSWSQGESVADEPMNETETAFAAFEFRIPNNPSGGNWTYELPTSVDVFARVVYKGRFAHFEARSFGPDGPNAKEKDYIYVGGRE